MLQGGLNADVGVNLAALEAIAQVLRRQVHVDQLIGHAQDVVGDALLDLDAGGLLHDVVQTLQVLNVQRADDVDACPNQLFNILVALGISTARSVGVGQLVDQGHCGMANQKSVEVHFLQNDAMVFDPAARHLFQVADQGRRLRPAMGFHHADDHVHAFALSRCASCSIS